MKVELKNGRLVISLKLRKPAPSKSGKTLLVATTRGPQESGVMIEGMPVRINANAFIDPPRKRA